MRAKIFSPLNVFLLSFILLTCIPQLAAPHVIAYRSEGPAEARFHTEPKEISSPTRLFRRSPALISTPKFVSKALNSWKKKRRGRGQGDDSEHNPLIGRPTSPEDSFQAEDLRPAQINAIRQPGQRPGRPRLWTALTSRRPKTAGAQRYQQLEGPRHEVVPGPPLPGLGLWPIARPARPNAVPARPYSESKPRPGAGPARRTPRLRPVTRPSTPIPGALSTLRRQQPKPEPQVQGRQRPPTQYRGTPPRALPSNQGSIRRQDAPRTPPADPFDDHFRTPPANPFDDHFRTPSANPFDDHSRTPPPLPPRRSLAPGRSNIDPREPFSLPHRSELPPLNL